MTSAPISVQTRSLWFAGIAFLLSGCTAVEFKAPIGTPMPAVKLAYLTGEWIAHGKDAPKGRIEQTPGSDQFIATWTDQGKEENVSFSVTSLVSSDGGNGVQLAWAEIKEHNLYMPLRILRDDAEDAVVLLIPDPDEVKKLVDQGKLSATYDDKNSVWIVSKGDFETVLESKEFWVLDGCIILTKINAAPHS